MRAVVNRLTPPRGAAGGSDRIAYGVGWWRARSGRDAGRRAAGSRRRLLVLPAVLVALVREPRRAQPRDRGVVGHHRSRCRRRDPHRGRGRDPAIGAWLDTEGRRTGMVSYRLIGARRSVTPDARVTTDARPWPDRADVDAAAGRADPGRADVASRGASTGDRPWMPPRRPPWVADLVTSGETVGPLALHPLAADELRTTAVAVAGADDFGGASWEELHAACAPRSSRRRGCTPSAPRSHAPRSSARS